MTDGARDTDVAAVVRLAEKAIEYVEREAERRVGDLEWKQSAAERQAISDANAADEKALAMLSAVSAWVEDKPAKTRAEIHELLRDPLAWMRKNGHLEAPR